MTHYRSAPWGARLAGILCAAGAIAILTEDVLTTHAVTLDHALQFLIVILAIAIGHLAAGELKRFRLHTGLPLAVVAALASFWCVYQTAGRTSATHQRQATANADAERRRPDAERRLAQNIAMLAEVRKNHAKECASGGGTRCAGLQRSIDVYEAAVKGVEGELKQLAPIPLNTSATALSRILARMPGITAPAAAIAEWLMLLDPLGPSLIFEVGSILCFSVKGSTTRCASRPAPETIIRADVPANCNRPADRPANRPECKKTQVLRALRADLEAGRSAGSSAELCLRHGVARATMSDWLREWEAAGVIPERRTVGRCKALRA